MRRVNRTQDSHTHIIVQGKVTGCMKTENLEVCRETRAQWLVVVCRSRRSRRRRWWQARRRSCRSLTVRRRCTDRRNNTKCRAYPTFRNCRWRRYERSECAPLRPLSLSYTELSSANTSTNSLVIGDTFSNVTVIWVMTREQQSWGRGVATGWTEVGISTQLLPEAGVPRTDAETVKYG